MAAPRCDACCVEIFNKKSYRKLNYDDFSAVFNSVGIQKLVTVCYQCFNKLNRIKNFEVELYAKINKLKASIQELANGILLLPGVKRTTISTPVACLKKRPIGTPTGVTPKSKRILFSSPRQTKTFSPRHIPKPKKTVDSSTQTVSQSSDFLVKVTVKYKGQERSKIINSTTEQNIVKAFLNNSFPSAVVKCLLKNEKYRSALISSVGKSVKNEVNSLCKLRETLLKTTNETNTQDMASFDWTMTAKAMNEKLPVLMGVLNCLYENKQKTNIAHLVTAVSVLLYSRSQNFNLIQMLLGIVLDGCGLTKEGVNILHSCGLSVSYSCIRKKTKQLISTQEQYVKTVVDEYKVIKSTESNDLVEFSHQSPDKEVSCVDGQNSVGGTCTTTCIRETACSAESRDTASSSTLVSHGLTDNQATCYSNESELSTCNTSCTEECSSSKAEKIKGIEVLGDNVDVTITPAHMTLDRQRKSLHWFLLMVKCNRVSYEDLHVSNIPQQLHVMDIGTHQWIPSVDQIKHLRHNFVFHISQILHKYVKELDKINYPEYITHDFIHLTKRKSVVLNCDLIDESENSSSGMIRILQKVHELTVKHNDRSVTERIVFGGDVLTNERAFSAQSAMQNNMTDFDSLRGVVHRPEGLHREFNFLTAIYQLFYKESSAADRGSLYQLRNLINRRDVSGPKEVKEKFRPHVQFIEDVTDAYILSAFLDMMDMEDTYSKPKGMPVLSLVTVEQSIKWLDSMSEKLLDKLQIIDLYCFEKMYKDLSALSEEDKQIEDMKIEGLYRCPLCTKTYSLHSWFRKHLEKVHQWKFYQVNKDCSERSPVRTFLFMALLFKDTCDSYKLGDGERIVRNAYFEWLFDSALHHSKYKLWLWRMITYCISVLGTEQSFEYKWNMCINLKGGITNNIPNDNGVELQVKNVKNQLNTQGVNKCFESAKKVCMTTQVVEDIKTNLIKKSKCIQSKRLRPEVDKSKDILTIVECLRKQSTIEKFKWKSFKKFQDPLQCVDVENLHSWIKNQKAIASLYL